MRDAHRASTLLGLYALVGGAASLSGWVLDIPRLSDWFGYGIAIQPNATLCVMFSGLGLLFLAAGRDRAAAACGAVVLCIGGLTLMEWLLGVSLGFDRWLLFGREWGSVGVLHAGRMGPPGSFSWTLIGIALLLSMCRANVCRFAPALAVTTAAISGLSLVGYLYGVDTLYALPSATVIALQTSTFVMAVSAGILARHTDREPMRTLLDPGGAGVLARRALPMLIVIPIVLGWLREKGRDFGLYDSGLGTALLVLILIGFLTALMSGPLRALRLREQLDRDASAKLAAMQLAEHERRLEMDALIQAAPAAIWVARDPQCTVVTGNSAAAALLRMSATDNMSIQALADASRQHVEVYRDGAQLRPDDLPLRMAARTGQAIPNQDLEFRFQDGASNWAYGNAVPLFSSDGQVRGAIGTFVDITPLKQAESLLRGVDRRKDAFLATLAHELRNPLAPIRNALAILRLSSDAQIVEGARDTIGRQVDQMVRLIDDLIDISRIKLGKLTLRKEHVELVPIINDAVEACRTLAETVTVQLIVNLPSEPFYLRADPVRLTQVFSNLLNNSCKFTPGGGQIDVFVQQSGDHVVVRIKDTGIGIPPDKLGDIFELFAQVDQSLERSQGGLGIGLTLVKQLVELHDGRIEALSEGHGKGSEFIVTLPLVEAPSETPHVMRPDTLPLASHRILIVDDNRDSAESLAMLLQLTGNHTLLAFDGFQAVAIATAERPDAVLLDIGLPGLNGYDTCRRIRAEFSTTRPVIIALTGWGNEEDRRQSSAAGFDGHLVKPVDHDVLTQMLTSLLAKSTAAQ